MEQSFLNQAQAQLTRLNEMNEKVEALKKQLEEKENEISQFVQEWKLNCNHVFYRVQEMPIVDTCRTKGYHCCLCNTFEKIKHPSNAQHTQSFRKSIRHRLLKEMQRPYPQRPPIYHAPEQPEETQEYIGTVIEHFFSDGKKKDEERFPIPAEYQAEVNCKKEHLEKLKTERNDLAEKLKELKETAKIINKDLDETTHLLNRHFGYPETVHVYENPLRRSRDDFYYSD